jgi:hypothetical protein
VIEPVIDELYVWFWTGTERPQLILDLTEVRTAFPGVIRPILTAKIEALPVCSAKQAAQLAASYQGGMAPCKSPDPSFNRRVVETVATDAELQTLIPAKLDLGDRLDQGDGADFWAETREELGGIRSLLTLIPFGWGLIGLLLVLLAVLNLDRRYTPFGWLAAPLLFSGLFMVIGGLIGPALADSIVQGSVTTSDLPPGAAFSAIQVVADKLFGTMRNLGFGTALIGLGCAITAVIGKRKGPHVGDHRSGVA